MEMEMYRELKSFNRVGLFKRSNLAWILGFQKAEKALVRNGRLKRVWKDNELYYELN